MFMFFTKELYMNLSKSHGLMPVDFGSLKQNKNIVTSTRSTVQRKQNKYKKKIHTI